MSRRSPNLGAEEFPLQSGEIYRSRRNEWALSPTQEIANRLIKLYGNTINAAKKFYPLDVVLRPTEDFVVLQQVTGLGGTTLLKVVVVGTDKTGWLISRKDWCGGNFTSVSDYQ